MTRRAQGGGLPDGDARRRAATDFSTNLVVLAGAGTGKTSLLVERVLNAIGSDTAPIDRLAAITFTEKAAGEMRERVALGLERLRALARAEVDPTPAEEADRAFAHLVGEAAIEPETIARRALDAMEELDRARVLTIHSFCSELLRAYPLEAGVDPDFAVDSGEHAEPLARTEWERFLTDELGRRATRTELWRKVLPGFVLGHTAEAARALAEFRIPDELLRSPVTFPDTRDLLGPLADRLVGAIESLLSRQQGITNKTRVYFEVAAQALIGLRDHGLEAFRAYLEQHDDVYERVLGENRRPRPNQALQGVDRQELDELSREVHALMRRLLASREEAVRDLVEGIAPFVSRFRESFSRQGLVSFDGLLRLTRDLLRDHPGVRAELKRRYRILLVDELQDTDPLQYEIVFFLAEALDESAATAYEARLGPGRLFAVGDAKQSIYRFRGADFAAYRRAIDYVVEQGGVKLDLVSNFRSVPGIVDPVNRLFDGEGGTWIPSTYQPEYVPIAAARDQPDDDPRVEVWTVTPAGDTAHERREAEGRVLAQEIRRLVEDEGRCRFKDITILFRAFTSISYYLRPLRARGIPFVVDGGKEFLERPEVEQLMAAMRTLAQPSDQPALLAFLRSPAGGVPDTELAAYASGGGRWDWRNRDVPADFPRVARAFERLRELERDTRHVPADAVVRRVLERTSLQPLGAAAFEGAQRVANLRKLASAAGELARDGRLSLEEVVEALAEGRLEDIKTDRPLADDAADAVRITSIHRMKGLENDWVFLPDLARQHRTAFFETQSVGVTTLPAGGQALAVTVDGVSNPAWVHLDHEKRLHESAEEVRVLYVAATRARERLVALTGPVRGKTRWLPALARWGYDAKSPPEDGASLLDGAVLHRRPRLEPVPRATVDGAAKLARQAVEAYEGAVSRLRAAASPPLGSPSGLHEEQDEAQPRRSGGAALGRGGAREAGKALGIVLHRLLETWPDVEPERRRERLVELCRESAATVDVDVDALIDEATGILAAFAGSGLARRLDSVEVLGRELPLLLRGDTVFRGSIDLLYRDGDGQIVVADYKTDRDEDDDALRRRYAEQLGVYVEAVQRTLGSLFPPQAELWLLRSGRRLTL
jgi:ATP-dependent helicase/nuclease subunit A